MKDKQILSHNTVDPSRHTHTTSIKKRKRLQMKLPQLNSPKAQMSPQKERYEKVREPDLD